jgi:hypothetical protein
MRKITKTYHLRSGLIIEDWEVVILKNFRGIMLACILGRLQTALFTKVYFAFIRVIWPMAKPLSFQLPII